MAVSTGQSLTMPRTAVVILLCYLAKPQRNINCPSSGDAPIFHTSLLIWMLLIYRDGHVVFGTSCQVDVRMLVMGTSLAHMNVFRLVAKKKGLLPFFILAWDKKNTLASGTMKTLVSCPQSENTELRKSSVKLYRANLLLDSALGQQRQIGIETWFTGIGEVPSKLLIWFSLDSNWASVVEYPLCIFTLQRCIVTEL